MHGRFNYVAASLDVGLHFHSLLRELPIVRARVFPTLVIETPPPNVSCLALYVSFLLRSECLVFAAPLSSTTYSLSQLETNNL